ncbi:hypothetical protein CTI12_AA514840 [Artemisia annua]|uniref:Uncharacterized protein n=1 Tax=Artemisia annua TaxID=35608 RepID=A0A2U1L9D5_ARTAN|nr:hypothetical protein CTI12_AA514840 [Artemisia annua]
MEPINEFHTSSIFIFSSSVNYDIYDDPTLKNEEQAKVKNVMQQEQITHLKGNSTKLIPYGMFLTRLYHYIMNFHPYLRGPQYSLFDPVMEPINEFHTSSIFIFSSSVNYDIYDDPTLKNEEQAKVKNVMQQEQITNTIDKTTS